jgi:osmotically-inducible protein OsmY
MKNNETLQRNVLNAIKWEPLLGTSEIGVTANDGVITLTGTVDSYIKKVEAENAARHVVGVKAVVEKIEIIFGHTWNKNDHEIAAEAIAALKANWQVPVDKVNIKVENGWITLDGELPWNYQKISAKNAVEFLMGVKGVSNNITIKPETQDQIEQRDIEHALERNWSIKAGNEIIVHVLGTKVILTGTVKSLYQKIEAERITWNTPGVWSVNNELVVEYDYSLVN